MASLWIDNDGCPVTVRELCLKGAQRRSIPTTIVGNSRASVIESEILRVIVVGSAFNAADDYIAMHCGSGDLVITSDVPLAARVVERGARAINARGDVFDSQTIGDRLAIRNLAQELRSGGEIIGGGSNQTAGQSQVDKKKFADALDRLLTQLHKLRSAMSTPPTA